MNKSHPSHSYMSNFERPSHISSYDSQEVMNTLKVGELSWTQAAWLFRTIWMFQQQSISF